MFIRLYHRCNGIHSPASKNLEIPCNFEDVYLGEDHINEELLLDNIPKDFLPDKPNNILLCVSAH